MNKQKMEEMLECLESIPTIKVQKTDSSEVRDLKIKCLLLIYNSANLLLECMKYAKEEIVDEDWNNWLRRHGMEEN